MGVWFLGALETSYCLFGMSNHFEVCGKFHVAISDLFSFFILICGQLSAQCDASLQISNCDMCYILGLTFIILLFN